MKVFLAVLLVLSGLVQDGSSFGAEPLTSRDFAYGYMLKVQEEGAVYSLPVPNEVYRAVRRADLGDIRIFNGAGEEVPHALRSIRTDDEKTRTTASVPFFPLYEAVNGIDNMSLSVRRDADGTIIDIDSRLNKEQAAARSVGYLFDLGKDRQNVGHLEIFWQADTQQSTSVVSVQQSSDLQRWYPLVHKATLVNLEYEGNVVVQRNIHLPRKPERYLKLLWEQGANPLDVKSVNAFSQPLVSRQNMQWVSLYNGVKSRADGFTTIDYRSGYRLPARSVRLRFTEPNSIIKASVQSRNDAKDEWREQCRAVFYTLQVQGETLESEPCAFGNSIDSEWRLVVLDDGAGISASSKNVMLDLGWQSDELLFIARGTEPFLLAYGSGKLEISRPGKRSDMVLSVIGQQQEQNLVKYATLGKRLELGGESALKTPPPPTPWKTWLLWTVLVAGVLVMALMVMNLVKNMKSDDKPSDVAGE
jgi:hypothetical protein